MTVVWVRFQLIIWITTASCTSEGFSRELGSPALTVNCNVILIFCLQSAPSRVRSYLSWAAVKSSSTQPSPSPPFSSVFSTTPGQTFILSVSTSSRWFGLDRHSMVPLLKQTSLQGRWSDRRARERLGTNGQSRPKAREMSLKTECPGHSPDNFLRPYP